MGVRYVTINTRLSPDQITRLIHQTLGQVFNRPTSPDHVTVASHISVGVFKENLKDFEAKSSWSTDRWGSRWKPLAPSTIVRKLGKAVKILAQSQKAHERGMASVLRSGMRRSIGSLHTLVPINIDTGRLVRSLTPYTGSRLSYSPSVDQIATVRRQELSIGTKVPYAKYVQNVRPILPTGAKTTPWVATALADGLEDIYSRVQ